jgi:hypothetical protein
VKEGEREREMDGADSNGNAVPCLAHMVETMKGREGTVVGEGDHRVVEIGKGEVWLTGVDHAGGVGPRWWRVIGARCSRSHAIVDGGVAIDNGCPQQRWRLAGEVAVAPCGELGSRGPTLNN